MSSEKVRAGSGRVTTSAVSRAGQNFFERSGDGVLSVVWGRMTADSAAAP